MEVDKQLRFRLTTNATAGNKFCNNLRSPSTICMRVHNIVPIIIPPAVRHFNNRRSDWGDDIPVDSYSNAVQCKKCMRPPPQHPPTSASPTD